MNRQFIGWIVAAVLAVALGGVLIFQAGDDGGGVSRQAALESGSAMGMPSQLTDDFSQIRDDKETSGNHVLPDVGPGQQPTQLQANPNQRCDPDAEPNAFAEWRNTPEDLGEAGTMADQIVVGTVMSAQKAAPFTVVVRGEPGNPQETPVQNVTIHVDQTVKGETNQGSNVTIQRLGDARGCFRVAGDEPFQQGRQYLLLLEDGAGNRPAHVISPEGRYMVRANNTLQSENENEFGEDVDGQRLGQVVSQLRSG